MNREQENLVDSFGFTSSHENEANVSVADHRRFTPLHYATQLDREEIVKLLLASGANTNALSTNLNNPNAKQHQAVVQASS